MHTKQHSCLPSSSWIVTAVNVSEIDGVAQLTVAISMPPGADPIETSFYLIVNTMDGSEDLQGLP